MSCQASVKDNGMPRLYVPQLISAHGAHMSKCGGTECEHNVTVMRVVALRPYIRRHHTTIKCSGGGRGLLSAAMLGGQQQRAGQLQHCQVAGCAGKGTTPGLLKGKVQPELRCRHEG